MMTDTEKKMVETKTVSEIRAMAATFRMFNGERDSKGRVLPCRYAVAASLVAKGIV